MKPARVIESSANDRFGLADTRDMTTPRGPQGQPYRQGQPPYGYPQQPQYGHQNGYPAQQPYGFQQPPAGYGAYPQIPQQRRAPEPPRKRRTWPKVLGGVLGGIGAVFVALIIAGLLMDTSGTSSSGGSSNAAPAVLTPAKPITAQEWQLIAKNPNGHKGQRIIVFGEVTQFDAATGTSTFRANVDGVEHKPEYGYADYPTNTILTGDAGALSSVVQGNLFTAEATVSGSVSYDTAIGGNMTAPTLTVTKLTVTGSL